MKAQNDKFLATMTPYLVILSDSEVSINSKRALNSVDFSPFCKRLKMTRYIIITKKTFKNSTKKFKNFF